MKFTIQKGASIDKQKDVNSESDIHLMLSVRDGNIANLAPLFERHHVKLYNYYVRLTGDRHLSEDMVQDVFLRMMRYRHTFRGEGQFTTWMFSIARNVQTDYARRWKREQPFSPDDDEEPGDPAADGAAECRYDTGLLEEALRRLPDPKREVLILSRYQGFKYAEIAAILGCSVENVKTTVYRAIRELRNIYFTLTGEDKR